MPDPRDVPIYTLAEAAHYARVPRKTVSGWLTTAGGVIEPAGTKPTLLSFWNFVEIWVLSSIRKVHGVSMQRTRKALAFVQRELDIERPLISTAFKTDGIDLFVDGFGGLVNASAGDGQLHLREVLEHYTKRIEYQQGVATQLYPFVRSFGEQPRAVVIDPSFGFGRPVISGTGIRTDVVFGRYRAGESVSALADDYNLSLDQIEDAIRAEAREAA